MKIKNNYEAPFLAIICFNGVEVITTSRESGATWPDSWSESGGSWSDDWTNAVQ